LLLLRSRWHIILIGLAFQYVHGIFTQLAYRMHQPAAQLLHDVGFELIPVSSSCSSSSSSSSSSSICMQTSSQQCRLNCIMMLGSSSGRRPKA
jgi:hypothetical protein